MSIIVNGASYRCTWWWTKHFSDDQENVRTTIVQSNGLASEDFEDMMREMQVMALASGTSAKNFMWICDISPHPDKYVTDEEQDRMRQIIEERRGLKGDVYFMIEQEKADGRKHFHLIELRIDLDTGRAVPDSKDAKVCHAAARQICEELGWERTISPFDKDHEGPRPERAPERWEMYRGMKSGIDPRDIQAEVTELFHQCDSGPAFKGALEEHGYQLVTGRRGLLILDVAGNEHSLARRIEGVTTKELNVFMRDVDRQALPTLEEGKAIYQKRKVAALEADRATVKQEIEWEEALAKAGIEKENSEQRFLPPQHVPARAESRNGDSDRREERQQVQPTQRELNKTAGDIRLGYQLTDSPSAFREFIQQQGLATARVTAEDIHERDRTKEERTKKDILQILHSKDAWMVETRGASALSPEHAIRAKEAYERWSTEKPEYAKRYDFDNYVDYVQDKWTDLAHLHGVDIQEEQQEQPPVIEKRRRELSDHAQANDVVVLDKWGNVYELAQYTTGENRRDAQAFVAGLDQNLPSIEDVRREQRQEGKPFMSDRELSQVQGDIRLAFSLSQSAEGFVQNLEELRARELQWEEYRSGRFRPMGDCVVCIARVTQEEAFASHVDSYYAKNLTGTDAEYHGQQAIDDPEYVHVHREGDYVVLTERGNEYSLCRATDQSRDEIEKFMGTVAPESVRTLTQARQFLGEISEIREAEYQAFRGLVGLESLKGGVSAHVLKQAVIDVKEEIATVLSGAGSAVEFAAQSIELGAKAAGPIVDTVANIAGEAIEAIGNMFGATAMTPERIQAALDGRERAAEQREIDLAERLRLDADFHRQKAIREREQLEEEARLSHERDKEQGLER